MSVTRIQVDLGFWSLTLAPDEGGRLASLRYGGADVIVPMEDTPFDPEVWPKAGANPLIPFHNRIPDARFQWGGREAKLAAHPSSLPHALHGHTSRAVWSHMTDGSMMLDSAAAPHWPWAFRAKQHFTAAGSALAVTLTITNHDTEPMPAGLGWHPYFPGGTLLADDAALGWQVGPEFLPEEGLRPRAELTGTTEYLTDWTRAEVRLPSGMAFELIASDVFGHLVRFAPADAPFACLEPVSHPVGALGGARHGDIHALAPGEILSGTITLRPLV